MGIVIDMVLEVKMFEFLCKVRMLCIWSFWFCILLKLSFGVVDFELRKEGICGKLFLMVKYV